METGFALTAFVAVVLNLVLPQENVEETAESLAGDIVEERNEEARFEADLGMQEKKVALEDEPARMV